MASASALALVQPCSKAELAPYITETLKILRMQKEHQAEITRLELRLKDADAKAAMNQQLLHDLLQEKK